ELERMAAAAEVRDTDNIEQAVSLRQSIFGYSFWEVEQQVLQQRSDLTSTVAQDLWESVREEQEILGHDREPYSNWPNLARRPRPTVLPSQSALTSRGVLDREYIFKLGVLVTSAHVLQDIAGLPHPPKL
ncbi:hypothetical protein DOTSEDRAFT_115416, partial [Dothistroma septosporum NZE10]